MIHTHSCGIVGVDSQLWHGMSPNIGEAKDSQFEQETIRFGAAHVSDQWPKKIIGHW